jgi:KUP system potassium uptake protein
MVGVGKGPHPTQGSTESHPGALSLALGALGVVYGDIGTSPLYTIRECFSGPHSIGVSQLNVMGVLSLIFWSLAVVVTFKYVGFILRADNKGEGGIFALMALVPQDGNGFSPRQRSAAPWG